jgi:hypothetical protein
MPTQDRFELDRFGTARGIIGIVNTGGWPRFKFASSSSVERRITHVVAGVEHAFAVAMTDDQYHGSARCVMWKGTVNEAEYGNIIPSNNQTLEGVEFLLELTVPINQTAQAIATIEAPLMILRPGEVGGLIMGNAVPLSGGAAFQVIGVITVGGVEIPADGIMPKSYKAR